MGSWSHSPHRIIPNTDIMMDFRAGKMVTEGRRVVPDTRKGIVRIRRGEDGLIHFQWLDRILNTVVDDQIVFPDEAVFEKVSQSSERVYILRFKSDNRKFFFWMQEPNSDGDLHLCNAVNYYINRRDVIGPPDPEDPLDMPEMLEDAADDDLSSRAGNLVDQSMGNELVGEVSSSAGPVQLADLQRILRNIQPAAPVEDPDGGLGLGDILRPELVMPLIENLPLEQELASYLPEGSCSPDILMELLQSSQFRQQVDTFTHVLQTGQIDLSQFGIDPSKYKFTVLSFLEALEDSVAKGLEDGGGVQPQRCSGGDAMDES